jgi:hypothetical protein
LTSLGIPRREVTLMTVTTIQIGCRFVFKRAAISTPDPEAVA